MDDIEDVGVSVMGCAQQGDAPLLLALNGDLARPGNHGRAIQHAPDGTSLDKAA